MLRIVAASVLIGLGTAGPAVASERHKPPPPTAPEPVAPLPAVPEPELPPLPIPDPPGPVTDPLPIPLPEPVFDPVFDPGAAPEPDFEPPSPEASTPEAETQPGASETDEQPATPDVTTTTQSDGGNVNVSVRVDSPGIEAPVVQEAPEPPVISLPAQPDITPAAGIVAARSRDAGDGRAPDPHPVRRDEHQRRGAGSEPRRQRSRHTDECGARPGRRALQPGELEPERYRREHIRATCRFRRSIRRRIRSINRPDDPGWIWNWTLTMCDGIVSSISDESGDQTSRDWTWNWIWNWTCGSAPATPDSSSNPQLADTNEDRGSGEPQPGPANVNVSIRILSPGNDGSVTQTNTSPAPASLPAGSGEPSWLWAWTFDWCGTTTAISTLAGEGTGLEWTWNWIWLWDCQPIDSPAPTPGDTAPADTGGDTAPPAASSPAPVASGPEISPSIVPEGGTGPAPSLVPSLVEPAAISEWVFRVPWATAIDLPAPLRAPMSADFATTTGNSAAIPWPAFPAPPVLPVVEVDIALPSVVPSGPATPSLPTVVVPTPTGTIQIAIDLEVPTPTSVLAAPAPDADAPLPDPGSPAAGARVPRAELPRLEASAVAATAAPSAPPVDRARARPQAEATARAPRSSSDGRPPFDFPLPLQVAGSSTSTGGVVPSLLTFGLATVIGFFAFAAPGLGRRIRLARIPSPRGRSHSPLDRPG